METIRNNLTNNASTQYNNFNHTALCMFDGVIIGAGPNGLFKLCCGDGDNGTAIDAYFIPYETDFNITQDKRVRRAYVSGEFDGDFRMTITGNGTNINGPYDIIPTLTDTYQVRRFSVNRIPAAGKAKFAFGKFKFENINGSFFAIDQVEVFCTLHNRRI